MTKRTAKESLESGYAAASANPPASQASRIATGYDPANDAEAEHIAKLGDKMNPQMRMGLGYQTIAREAAEQVAAGEVGQ